MEEEKVIKKKSKKRWIIPLSIVGGLVLTFGLLFLISTFNTQMIVGLIQKATYGNKIDFEETFINNTRLVVLAISAAKNISTAWDGVRYIRVW